MAALCCLSAGCLAAYEPDRFLVTGDGRPDPHARRLDCLDVRVDVHDDAAVPASWPVVGVEVGNRCRDAVYVDLRHVRVVATWDAPERLRAFDPRYELAGAILDGRGRAQETIAYVAPDGRDARPGSVCVDVSGITEAPAVAPICFDFAGEGPS